MATSHVFEGKTYKLPGVRSTIKSGIKNPPIDLGFGSLLIIDTGLGAGYLGGAGISGELTDPAEAFYTVDNIEDYRLFTKGGIMWLLGEPLFRPAGVGINGVSSVTVARAAETVAASASYSFSGDGSGSVATGGTLTIKTRDEGLVGNGVEDIVSGELIKGYGVLMEAGINDTAKYVLKFYVGQYPGDDTVNGVPYGGLASSKYKPRLLIQTPEFDNIQEAIDWMNENATFNEYFTLSASSVSGDGTIEPADLAANNTMNLFSGGTETYSTTHVDSVLAQIAELNVDFILATDYGADAQSADNFKIFSHIIEDSLYKPQLYIASRDDRSGFSASIADAAYYDNQYVTVVHGGAKKSSRVGTGFNLYPAIYKAAALLGREAGLEPQVPLTFKNININGEQHLLNSREQEQALDAGLLVTALIQNSFDIVKGVNSLQENTFLVNEDGTTPSKQILRIARQLNKEIIINARRQLLKKPDGTNRNTLSENDVASWLEGYLLRKIATPQDDNLILAFQDITVTRDQDAYRINYGFIANSEINFLFFTGFMLDV